MTIKTPTAWLPQPLGYGSVTVIATKNLVDQSSNQLVDQSGNSLITGIKSVVSQKTPITWTNTGA